MYFNNHVFSIKDVVHWLCFLFFQIRRWRRSNYTQNTALIQKQKKAWKSSTTTTWLWSSWRRTFRSLLLSGENSWFQTWYVFLCRKWEFHFMHISLVFRPICIPCTQETSNALGLVGDSTCQQQGETTPVDMLQLRLHDLKRKRFHVLLFIVDTKRMPSVFLLQVWCRGLFLPSPLSYSIRSLLFFLTYRGKTAGHQSWKTFLPDQKNQCSASKGRPR